MQIDNFPESIRNLWYLRSQDNKLLAVFTSRDAARVARTQNPKSYLERRHLGAPSRDRKS